APVPPPSTTFENTRVGGTTTAVLPFLTSPALMSEAYAFPSQDRAAFRDFQYQNDQLEIENQKLLLRIEQNKAKQAQLLDKERALAFDFATHNQINLELYEVDPVNVAFVKK